MIRLVNTVHILMNYVGFMNHFKNTLCTSYRRVNGACGEARLRASYALKWGVPLSEVTGYQG